MSCHPELTYAIYVDGELDLEERRPVEAHLVGCLRCRELVVSLREEVAALGDALLDQDPAPLPAPAPALAPARGLAVGIVPVLVAVTLATAAVGWLLEVGWPASTPVLTTLGFGGLYDMFFDLIYLLRDEAPGAFDMALAVAAMATISGMLSFGLTVALRRWQGPTLLTLCAVLAALTFPESGQAHFGLHEHRDYQLREGEVHDGTLVAHGGSVLIDGVVDGDLIAFTRRLAVRGEVRGNIIAIARDAEIPGRVTGTLHVAGRSVRVTGTIGENLYGYGGEHFELDPTGSVGRDVAAGGEEVRIAGSVGRDLFAGGDAVEVRGTVGRDLNAWAEQVSLEDGARIGGLVDARLPSGAEVSVAPGALIGGEVRSSPWERGRRGGFARFADPFTYAWMALHIGAAFTVGMVLYLLVPGIFQTHLQTGSAFLRSLGVGFAAAVLAPIALALLALTLIGVPLALIGAAVYLTTLYTSLIVVSYLVGQSVVRGRPEAWTGFGMALLVGLVIVVLATHAPFLGHALRIVMMLAGLGLLVDRARYGWAELRGQPA